MQGTIETLLAGAVCGTTYALFSGQPLTIISATGPLLVFESILYQTCKYVLHYFSTVIILLVYLRSLWNSSLQTSGVKHRKPHPAPQCSVLPPGIFTGIILEALPISIKVSLRLL